MLLTDGINCYQGEPAIIVQKWDVVAGAVVTGVCGLMGY